MKKWFGQILAALFIIFLCLGVAHSKEYKGMVSDNLNFSEKIRLKIEGTIIEVSIGIYTEQTKVDDVKSFTANPTGRVGAAMKFSYLPESDQYKVTFWVSARTNKTSGASFVEGILSP